MNEAEVIEICREAILVMLKISGPILIAGLVVGVIVSLVQTITQDSGNDPCVHSQDGCRVRRHDLVAAFHDGDVGRLHKDAY